MCNFMQEGEATLMKYKFNVQFHAGTRSNIDEMQIQFRHMGPSI